MKKDCEVDVIADIKNLLAFGSPTLIIFLLATFTVVWGLWFLAPWNVISGTPTLEMMGKMMSEHLWGLLFTFAGLGKMSLLIHYLHDKRVKVSHIVANFAIFFMWSVVFSSILVSNWQSTGTITYGFVVLISLWVTAKRLAEYNLEKKEGAVNG